MLTIANLIENSIYTIENKKTQICANLYFAYSYTDKNIFILKNYKFLELLLDLVSCGCAI